MTNLTLHGLLRIAEQLSNPLYSKKIFIDDNACIKSERVQFRFARRKSKRIASRWAKNPKNWKVKTKEVYYETPFGLIISSRLHKELVAQAKQQRRSANELLQIF